MLVALQIGLKTSPQVATSMCRPQVLWASRHLAAFRLLLLTASHSRSPCRSGSRQQPPSCLATCTPTKRRASSQTSSPRQWQLLQLCTAILWLVRPSASLVLCSPNLRHLTRRSHIAPICNARLHWRSLHLTTASSSACQSRLALGELTVAAGCSSRRGRCCHSLRLAHSKAPSPVRLLATLS